MSPLKTRVSMFSMREAEDPYSLSLGQRPTRVWDGILLDGTTEEPQVGPHRALRPVIVPNLLDGPELAVAADVVTEEVIEPTQIPAGGSKVIDLAAARQRLRG